MAILQAAGSSGDAANRRRALAGKSGWVSRDVSMIKDRKADDGKAGLVHNRRIFAIAVFASLGGL